MTKRKVMVFGSVVVALASIGLPAPSDAHVEIPGSCHPGSSHGLPPGCAHALDGELKELRDPGRTLPNLVPRIPYAEVGVFPYIDENGQFAQGKRHIRFDVAVRNEGRYAMDLLGDPSLDLMSTTVQQCVSWTERVCRERLPVGGFEWHPQHNHFHFQEFATYELRRLDATGAIDRSPEGLLQVAPKVSFCLMDYEAASDDPPPAFYVLCLGTNQGISAGWADVYASYLDGQGLVSEGLPDGLYGLVVILDPNDRLYETNEDDNETSVIVELFDNGNQARLVGPAPG
jgi:hypothetical protein